MACLTEEEQPLGKLEFTHHIYEEYQPILPRESKPPIIVQSVPYYSVSNFFYLYHRGIVSLPFKAIGLEVVLFLTVMTGLTECWIWLALSGLRLRAAIRVAVA